MFNRKFILILIVAVAIISISAVSASDDSSNSTDVGDSVKSVTLNPQKLSTTYGSGKDFKVKAVDDKTKKPVSNLKITLKVYSGKKSKKVTKTSDSNGVVKYSASKLSVGKHKIIVNVKDTGIVSKSKTSTVKISKAKLKISAPKITHKYKKNEKYKITVKNKESKKVMKGIKLTVKVYTGKKFKKYSLKTNKKGIASFNMKSLKKGSHKVVIKVKANSKVKSSSAKSKIRTVEGAKYIKLKVNGHEYKVKLASNKATKALLKKLKKGAIKIHAHDYGDFEKVGDLGFSLPASDKYITTSVGDVVLYNGDEISLFYDSNSWEYTKLGKVQNVNGLKKVLGSGDVTLIFSLN